MTLALVEAGEQVLDLLDDIYEEYHGCRPIGPPFEESAVLRAQLQAFAVERKAHNARLTAYKRLLEEHGIPAPDEDGEHRLYEASRRVLETAVDFMQAADELKRIYGSAKELL